MSGWYGFNFSRENAGGLGAALHAMMLALHYAKVQHHSFGLIEEGMHFPRFNGSIDDLGVPDKNFRSYFKGFPLIKTKQAIAVWFDCPNGWNISAPEGENRLEWYSKLMEEVYQLREETQVEVDRRVNVTGFNPMTDIVLHVRRTDKIFAYQGSTIESAELPLVAYFDSTMRVIRKKFSNHPVRVFLCTDDKSSISYFEEKFKGEGISLVFDQNEPDSPLQALRIGGKLTKSAAWEENLEAMKNIQIMTQGLYLIGGRMSYFFRVAELLRYPLPTLNIKDQEKFGKAPYAEPNESFANPFWPRRYLNFVEKEHSYSESEGVITIKNFISEEAAQIILENIAQVPENWWSGSGSISPDHFKTCQCFSCRLRETLESYEVLKAISEITRKFILEMTGGLVIRQKRELSIPEKCYCFTLCPADRSMRLSQSLLEFRGITCQGLFRFED